MTKGDLDAILTAYRRGLKADMIQASTSTGQWGTIFCLPPCSPSVMESAGRQFARSRAENIRHCRRARLRGPSATQDVIIATVLPMRQQTVARISDGTLLALEVYLEDAPLVALDSAFASPLSSRS